MWQVWFPAGTVQAQSYGVEEGKRRNMAWAAFIFLVNPTALTVSLVPATALLSIKGLCVHVPQVPSAGLWGHPQVSQDGPFFGNNMVLDCLSEPCISFLLPCCILVPRDIFL